MAKEKIEEEQPNAAVETPEQSEQQMSAKDRYRSRIAQDYPDVNMDDEEAYYNAANDRYDDYTNMKGGLKELNTMIDNNPLFREMMVAASEGGAEWNPFKWAAEQKGLDLKALAEDPEYADAFAEAQRKHLKSIADGDAMKKDAADNYAASEKAIEEYCQQNGISAEQKAATWAKIEDLLNDANVGKVSVETFALLCKGGNYDSAVESARNEGMEEGLGKNVTDKLRKMPKPEKTGGRQMAEEQPKPTRKSNNPFMA